MEIKPHLSPNINFSTKYICIRTYITTNFEIAKLIASSHSKVPFSIGVINKGLDLLKTIVALNFSINDSRNKHIYCNVFVGTRYVVARLFAS